MDVGLQEKPCCRWRLVPLQTVLATWQRSLFPIFLPLFTEQQRFGRNSWGFAAFKYLSVCITSSEALETNCALGLSTRWRHAHIDCTGVLYFQTVPVRPVHNVVLVIAKNKRKSIKLVAQMTLLFPFE